MNKQTLTYIAVFLAGVILASKVRGLPGLSKLPTV
jgi:hypothetical protein